MYKIFKNKKVIVTGHTGFKGSWLTMWLIKLGAQVVGISKDIPTKPSMFEELNIKNKMTHYIEDVRNLKEIDKIINNERPDFIFHLAAQPIVSLSYEDPTDTISSNVIGTMNILECLRSYNDSCTAILITSDKCYDNVEWIWGYKETDSQGGKDIYSGSKGAAELIIKSYYHSFFKKNKKIKIASARAGNVIGGGDWATNRIIPDCIRSWNKNDLVEIRSPKATRPWQHVLEPLSGYLTLAEKLFNDDTIDGESFNFGPNADQNHTVVELIEKLSSFWDFKKSQKVYKITENIKFNEASLLKLNCDKALFYLDWKSSLNYNELLKFTGEWYYNFYFNKTNMFDFTINQIEKYESKSRF